MTTVKEVYFTISMSFPVSQQWNWKKKKREKNDEEILNGIRVHIYKNQQSAWPEKKN